MSEDLKKETVKGVAWSAVEKFSTGGVLFLANIILARILTPKDFGLLAIINIFIIIAQTFIDSGFSNALIQKKDRNQIDYSTVFFFNLAISIGLYLILFISAPYISLFFDNPQLTLLTRIVGLNLFIGALVSVHRTRLTILLKFKSQSLITLSSSIIAAVVSIYFAYKGIGVWALVLLSLINISLQTILFYIITKWHPSLVFSSAAFKKLFSYSSKLLGASLIHQLYRNIYTIVIGKFFSPTELGYFNRADTLAMYPAQTIGQVISRVAFPIFSRIQDDNNRLGNAYSKYIIFSSLIIFPIMIGIIVLAKPLTLLILTDKWLPMVPLLRILCIDWMTDHLCMINLNVLYVKGRSDLALKLEIIKKTAAICIFFISLYWGIIGVCWGRVIYGLFAVYLNSYYTKRLIGISFIQQLKDITKPLMQASGMGLIIYLIICNLQTNVLQVVYGIGCGIIIYITIIYFTSKSYLNELCGLLHK